MKIIVNGKIYDSESTPIMLVWQTDQERKYFLEAIKDMEPKPGVRIYSEFPSGSTSREDVEKMLDAAADAVSKRKDHIEILLPKDEEANHHCVTCSDKGYIDGCPDCGRFYGSSQENVITN